MEGLGQYLVPWLFSNAAALIILWAAWANPTIGRGAFAFLFGWAAWKNVSTAQYTPELYLEYANFSLPLYQDFILGWFADHVAVVVTVIAIGQALIAIGMILKGVWVKVASLGAILFLIAIAPLGVGAGFPFSITASIAAWLIYRSSPKNYLWKFKLHTHQQTIERSKS